ncbi:MAG: hypothetical protein IIA88_09040 [Bacteroidetes bacterium]|nr:hypothetical protein [Bacteroidota bacterium]
MKKYIIILLIFGFQFSVFNPEYPGLAAQVIHSGKIYQEGVVKFLHLYIDPLTWLILIDESQITADGRYIVEGIKMGEFDNAGEFMFANLSDNQIQRLGLVERSNITPDRKYVIDQIIIGSWDENGEFHFADQG